MIWLKYFLIFSIRWFSFKWNINLFELTIDLSLSFIFYETCWPNILKRNRICTSILFDSFETIIISLKWIPQHFIIKKIHHIFIGKIWNEKGWKNFIFHHKTENAEYKILMFFEFLQFPINHLFHWKNRQFWLNWITHFEKWTTLARVISITLPCHKTKMFLFFFKFVDFEKKKLSTFHRNPFSYSHNNCSLNIFPTIFWEKEEKWENLRKFKNRKKRKNHE